MENNRRSNSTRSQSLSDQNQSSEGGLPTFDEVKQKEPLIKYVADQTDSVLSMIKSQDQYGKKINLNYQNDGTYKTVPGGCLSLIFKVLVFGFFIVEWSAMTNYKDIQFITHEILSKNELLEHTHKLNDKTYKNLTMGVQIVPKKPKLTTTGKFIQGYISDYQEQMEMIDAIGGLPPSMQNSGGGGGQRGGFGGGSSSSDDDDDDAQANLIRDFYLGSFFNMTEYQEDLKNITRYLGVYGMFEKFDGRNYRVFDSEVNRNSYNWSAYENNVTLNSHGYYQLTFNLTEGALQGTEQNPLKMDLVTSNYQFRLKVPELQEDSLISCRMAYYNDTCNDILDSLTVANRNFKVWTYSQYDTLDAQGKQGIDLINDQVDAIVVNGTTTEKRAFLHNYHLEVNQVGLLYHLSGANDSLRAAEGVVERTLQDKIDSIEGVNTTDANQQRREWQQALNRLPGSVNRALREQNATEMREDYEQYSSTVYYDQADIDFAAFNLIEEQNNRYEANHEQFMQDQEDLFARYNFEYVIYDEVEVFRDWSEDLFNYPYADRKTVVSLINSTIDDSTANYEFFSHEVIMKLSDVCQEGYKEYFFEKMFKQIGVILDNFGLLPKEKEEDDDDEEEEDNRSDREKLDELLQPCKRDQHFTKLKYEKLDVKNKIFDQYYEPLVIDQRILTEFVIKLDKYTTRQTRSSTQMLGFLSKVGGLVACLQLIFGLIGGYFSYKLLLMSVGSTLFIRQKDKKDLEAEELEAKSKGKEYEGGMTPTAGNKIEEQFVKINLSKYDVILDSMTRTVLCCFYNHRAFKKKPFKRRLKILDKVEQKFTQEMNIDQVLKKVRDSHAMVSNLPQAEDLKPFLKYNKNNVLLLSESSEYNSDENDDQSEKEESIQKDDDDDSMADEEIAPKDPQAHDYFAESHNTSKFDEEDTENKLKYDNDLALAFKRSVVQGMPFDKEKKLEMMDYVPPKPQSPYKDPARESHYSNQEFPTGKKLLQNLPTDRFAQTPNTKTSKHQVHPNRGSQEDRDKIAVRHNQLVDAGTKSTFQNQKNVVNLGLAIETSLESDRHAPRDSTKGLMKTNSAFHQGKIVADAETARGENKDQDLDTLEQQLNEVTEDNGDIYENKA